MTQDVFVCGNNQKREYEKYGKTAEIMILGRVHLDSLELYLKYTYEERHTYPLDAIGELEVGEKKTVYEGTLRPNFITMTSKTFSPIQ